MKAHCLVPALAIVLLGGCGPSNSTIQEVWSPNRRQKAVVYTAHGGATGSLNTNVSVLEAPFGKPGLRPNTFSVIHGDTLAPEGPYFGPAITVRWIDPSTVEIRYDPRAHVMKKASRIGDTRVVYVVEPQQGLPPDPRAPAVRPE